MRDVLSRSLRSMGAMQSRAHRLCGRVILKRGRSQRTSTWTGALTVLGVLGLLAPSYRAAVAEDSEPLAPLPLTVVENPLRVALGERLFHDPRLSHRSERSCATCHPLARGAMDGRKRGQGAGGAQLRNTPTLHNVGFNFFFNWDGSVTTLEDHAAKVLLNPRIMNGNWPELLTLLRAEPRYSEAFAAAYPDGLTQANVADALASFQRSLITPNARFDRYLRGERGVITQAEEEGYRLFKSLGCVACHQGVNIGGNLFQKFGIFRAPTTPIDGTDPGRQAVTLSARDRGVYRVPSLRNVAVTAPYFHDGRAATLEEAVNTMAREQLGRPLASPERSLIVQFLRTLTGEYRGKPVTRGAAAEPQ